MDLRKNVTIFQKGGSTHVSPALLVIRVVLLQALYGVSNPLIPQLYVQKEKYEMKNLCNDPISKKVYYNFSSLGTRRKTLACTWLVSFP